MGLCVGGGVRYLGEKEYHQPGMDPKNGSCSLERAEEEAVGGANSET